MAEITLITVQQNNKERCNIFVDGEYSFALSMELVVKFGLKKGKILTDEEKNTILLEAEKGEALAKGVDYACKYVRTKRQIKDYLLKKGYPQDTVYYVIDKLKEYNYVNDVEFAKKYLELYSSKEGKRLSEYKLMSKGIRKEDIEKAYSEITVNPHENAKAVAEKYMRNKEFTKENLQKTYKYLIGKGFSYEEASSAIAGFKEG